MKIVIYTTNECKFSQQEKEFLKSKNLTFEEKNIETNSAFLTEMLSISGNFAGTPVTEITKDNGEKVVLKGFTVEDFNEFLNPAPVSSTETTASVAPVPTEQMAPAPFTSDQPVSEIVSEPAQVQPVVNPEPIVTNFATEPPVAPVETIPQLNTTTMPNVADVGVVDLSQSVASEPDTVPLQEPIVTSAVTDSNQSVATVSTPSQPAVDSQLNSVLQNLQNQANNNQG
jgi:glutaredoxin